MKRTILITLTITLSSVALFAQTKLDSAFTLKASKGSKITSWTSTISTTSTPILDSAFIGATTASDFFRLYVAPDFNLSHPTLSVVAGQPKPIMQIKALSNGKQTDFSGDWDTMVISINKKQIHWLNDSTAIYIKN